MVLKKGGKSKSIRHKKGKNGLYTIKGKAYKMLKGSRAQVGHKIAYKTNGNPGLKFEDLKQNKHGRWVSKKMSKLAKKNNRLGKAGYKTKKGVFGSFKNGKPVKMKNKTMRRKRGGGGGNIF